MITPKAARRICPDFLDVIPIDDGTLILIMPAGVSKWSGIEDLLRRWGMTADGVAAFGDDRNDLPMIRGAGCGVAMENAIAEVRAAADIITRSNNDDGIACFLENMGI